MRMTPYLGFDGNCREAFEFYAKTLGGKVEMMMTYGESPMCNEMPAESHGRIMHACVVADGALLMGGDAPPGRHEAPKGIMVALEIDDAAKAKRVFETFAGDGTVTMPFEETFWVERFGMVTDRFGIPWAINGGKSRMG
ncbi:MAG TPA: VOC family protein [Gammaproteobacteria bacterium]